MSNVNLRRFLDREVTRRDTIVFGAVWVVLWLVIPCFVIGIQGW